jgi:GH35 family endo-1,4-beta-xylanase
MGDFNVNDFLNDIDINFDDKNNCDNGCDSDVDGDADTDADMDADTDSDGDEKFVGNITTDGRVWSDFLSYWDQITPENEGKWGSVEAVRDSMDWLGVQNVYDFAKMNGIPFKEHTFVWGNQYPYWIDDLGPSEQAAEIEEWIASFCEKFPDTDMIDVVNEALPNHAPAYFAESAFGPDWVYRSFELARMYCPNSILILNDYNVLRYDTEEFTAFAAPLIASGFVDAIGCQAHGLSGSDGDIQSASELKANLDRVASLGVPIYISEYDIDQADDSFQLDVMEEQFPIFYNHPSVAGITLWGYIVGYTWRPDAGLLYTDGTPRPALTWLMDYLGRR